MIRIEHANICVTEIEPMIAFLRAVNPEFCLRGEGTSEKGTRWVHFGDDVTYFALQQAASNSQNERKPYSGVPGLNHLGVEVDNVDTIRERMLKAGYRESTVPNNHPFRKRAYFYDPEGNDWEFVQYFSQNPKERNDYETPDR